MALDPLFKDLSTGQVLSATAAPSGSLPPSGALTPIVSYTPVHYSIPGGHDPTLVDSSLMGIDTELGVLIAADGGASALSSLTDVTITSIATGNFLRYNGSKWINTNIVAADIPTTTVTAGSYTNTNITVGADGRITAASTGSAGAAALTTLTDVTITSPIATNFLQYNGTKWINAALSIPTSALTGTLAGAQFPALTGDVVTAAGTLVAYVSSGAITLAKMNGLVANSIIGNNTGSTATPVALSIAQVNAMLGSTSGTVTTASVVSANGFGGTVATATTTPAITLTTSISGILKGASSALVAATSGTDFSAGTSALATGIVKSTTSTGALSIAVAADFPTLNQSTTGNAATATSASNASTVTTNANLTGPVTSVGNATSIAANAITLAMMAKLAANTIIGNNTGSGTTPLALTTSQVNTLLGCGLLSGGNTWSGAQTISSNLTESSAVIETGVVTLAVASSTSYTSASFSTSSSVRTIRLTGSPTTGTSGLCGFTAQSGQQLRIVNVCTTAILIKNQSATEGTTANRITTSTGADFSVATLKVVDLWYDITSATWRMVGST